MEKLKDETPSENRNDDHPLKKKKESEVSERIAEIFSIQQKNNDKELIEKVTIGTFLRRERESKQFSLKKISNRTKISITILEQLESDNFIELPNKAYVRGFVRSYAQVLNLNLDLCQEILDHTYNSMKGGQQNTKKITAFDDPPLNHKVAYVQLGVTLGGITLLLAIIFFAIRSTQQEAKLEIEKPIVPIAVNSKTPLKGLESPVETKAVEKVAKANPEVVVTPSKVVEKAPVVIAEKIKPHTPVSLVEAPTKKEKMETVTDDLFIKPHELKAERSAQLDTKKTIKVPPPAAEVKTVTQEVKPGPSAQVAPPKVETTKVETPKLETKPLEGQLYTEVSREDAEKSKEFLPDNIRAAMIPGLQNVFINAHAGDSWITYKKDDEPIKKFVLKQGKTILIRGKEIRIFLGNTGVSKVYLNNKLLNLNAPTGVKSLVFPQENASKYKIPLFIYKDSGEVITSDNI